MTDNRLSKVLADLDGAGDANAAAIAANTSNISTNTAAIAVNTADISSVTATANNNTAAIGTQSGLIDRLQSVITVGDLVGGTTFTGTAITVPVTSVHSNGTIGTLASNELTITNAGEYLIHMQCGIDTSVGTSRADSEAFMELDTGGGYATIPLLRVDNYHRTVGVGIESGSATRSITLAAGDKLRLRAQRTSGTQTLVLVAERSGFTVQRLE